MPTTIERLSRYLPYGTKVRCDITHKVYTLVAIDARTWQVTMQDENHWRTGQGIDIVTPILRPFESLVKPIDGIIPAVEVARMALLMKPDETIQYNIQNDGLGTLIVTNTVNELQVHIYGWQVYCYSSYRGTILPIQCSNQFPIFRKLLGWQFAVGLEESQFIRKEE